MANVKYKKIFQEMSDLHEELFLRFDKIHAGYLQNRKEWSKQFHSVGQEVVEIIREGEHTLCAGMERGANGVYSSKLAEKFWDEVKKRYSHIQLVGVKSNLD
jgi:hypothetical protein